MHDPSTLVLDINIPFTGKKNKKGGFIRYPKTLISIWHIDPESDGSDDSCDWFGGDMSDDLRERVKAEGAQEWQYYHDPKLGGDRRFSSDVEIVFSVWGAVDWRFGKRRRRRTAGEIDEIFSLASNPSDNLSHSIQDSKKSSEGMGHLFYIVFSNYLRFHRPWYKHPRLHFWHYQIRVVPIQLFKRWAFSRCQGCGGRFHYGESPTSTSWDSDGPKWFKSERSVYHSRCVPAPMKVAVDSSSI
jgi:hypothetical protein